MVEINGEVYLNAKSASEYIGVTRSMFYNNVRGHIPAHKIGAHRRKYYKRLDLERFRLIETVA